MLVIQSSKKLKKNLQSSFRLLMLSVADLMGKSGSPDTWVISETLDVQQLPGAYHSIQQV